MLDRRPFWGLIIWLNLCVVIWLVTMQEPVLPDVLAVAEAASVPGSQGSDQTSANGTVSKPNQIHDSSRTQLSKRSSNHSFVSSLDKAATPVPPVPVSTAASTQPSGADARQLIDLHNFSYLITQPACGPNTQALILVHTAPRNVEKRRLIRQTWGGPLIAGSPLRIVFLLGAVSADEEATLQRALALENARHADMVQGNFQDAYRNMTYKHVMALKWFHNNCAQARVLLKVDDDVYVNTPQLLKYMQPPSQAPSSTTAPLYNLSMTATPMRAILQQPHELLLCLKFVGARVKRSYRSKWRVSFSEYAERYYPPYCPGFAIVYSADVVQRLYEAAQQARYFWVDDVHITGVLAQRTNTSITTLKPYVMYASVLEQLLAGQTDIEQLEFLVSWHSISPQQISALWQMYTTQNYTLTSGLS